MSQVDGYTIPGSPLSMAGLQARLQDLFPAAVSCNRGETAPQNPMEGMLWWDSSSTNELLKRYSAAQGWVPILSFNTANGQVIPYRAGTAIGVAATYAIASQAQAQAGTATNVLMTPQRTAQAIAALVGIIDIINGTSGTLTVARGGTGATTAAAALSNLGGTPTGRTITAGNGLTGGGNLAANRTIALGTPGTLTATTTNAATAESHTHNIDIATQAEAQAGTNTTKLMTPQRVAQAIGALAGGLGYGQTWQDMSAQRQVQTVYQNTTGKPIMVLFGTTSSRTQRMSVSHNNSTWIEMALAQNNDNGRYIYIIVPPGHYYRAENAGDYGRWLELR